MELNDKKKPAEKYFQPVHHLIIQRLLFNDLVDNGLAIVQCYRKDVNS